MMTAKQEVLEVYPTANARCYRNTMGQTSHWLVWSDIKENTRLGSGKTKAEAWDDATKNLSKIKT